MPGLVSLGVTLLTLFGALLASLVSTTRAASECNMANDLMVIQSLCHEPNDALFRATNQGMHDEVCRQLFLSLKCVATNIPKCFDEFDNMNNIYSHSPHYCLTSKDELLELQEIILSKQTDEPDIHVNPPDVPDSNDKNPDVIITDGHTTPDSAPEPISQGGGGSGGHYNIGTGDSQSGANEGTKEGQTGSEDAHDGSCSVTPHKFWVLLVALSSGLLLGRPQS